MIFTEVVASTELDIFSVALGDINGDKRLDIVVGTAYRQDNYVFYNNGNRSFIQQSLVSGYQESALSISLGDMDGDGLLDIVLGTDNRAQNRILYNKGSDGRFNNTFYAIEQPRFYWTESVTLGDFDKGKPKRDFFNSASTTKKTHIISNNRWIFGYSRREL